MTDTTKVLWRVQVRKSRKHKWTNKGLYETRAVAREAATEWRTWEYCFGRGYHGYGFGNTRVVRHERGAK